eukprot:15475828-Alexandrium_andersonii.AAC.1
MECTPSYPVLSKLRDALQDTHRVVYVKTGPELMGQPVSRFRLHGAGLAHQHMVWLGPDSDGEISRDFHNVFGRSCELDGDVYFQSPPWLYQQ